MHAGLMVADLPGPDGQTSLREAVCASNATPGAIQSLYRLVSLRSPWVVQAKTPTKRAIWISPKPSRLPVLVWI